MMKEEYCGRMRLSYLKCCGGSGGYLISEEPLQAYLAKESTRCINVWLRKSFDSLPPLGFSLHAPEKIRSEELTADPGSLSKDYLVCLFNDPAMPRWCFSGAQSGDRLRMRFEGAPGQYTAQFRLNQLPPTHPYDVHTAAPIYFVIKVDGPNDVAVLTEDETVYCRTTASQPFNQLSLRQPKSVAGDKNGTRERVDASNGRIGGSNEGNDRSSTSTLEMRQQMPVIDPSPSNESLNRTTFAECVVCTDRPVELLNFPCHHATSCSHCFEMVCNSAASAAELKCPLCRNKVVHSRSIVQSVEKCAFDGCLKMDAAAMPCGCVVGCYVEASKRNGFCQRGELPPPCPACKRKVAAFHQVFFP